MIIRVCAFTPNGYKLADRIVSEFKDEYVEIKGDEISLADWTKESFRLRTPLIFIGACGIAVRTIAPYVNDKLTDSAVIVVDELGHNVIPILSGHMGGGNNLAKDLADRLGGSAILTTATDINSRFAVDNMAAALGLGVANRDGIARVSTKVLGDNNLNICISNTVKMDESQLDGHMTRVAYPPDNKVDVLIDDTDEYKDRTVLLLKPKRLCVGVGCRKGMDEASIRNAVVTAISQIPDAGTEDIYAFATIDLKAREYGLLSAVSGMGCRLYTYTAEELEKCKGEYSESKFVKSVTGVDNVCERACMRLAGEGAELLIKKTVFDGITIAIAKRLWIR